MHNFIRIFSVIKKYCSDAESMQKSQLDKVIKEVGPVNGLGTIYYYLDILQDLGMIMYSVHSNSVVLTEKGLKTEKLFS